MNTNKIAKIKHPSFIIVDDDNQILFLDENITTEACLNKKKTTIEMRKTIDLKKPSI